MEPLTLLLLGLGALILLRRPAYAMDEQGGYHWTTPIDHTGTLSQSGGLGGSLIGVSGILAKAVPAFFGGGAAAAPVGAVASAIAPIETAGIAAEAPATVSAADAVAASAAPAAPAPLAVSTTTSTLTPLEGAGVLVGTLAGLYEVGQLLGFSGKVPTGYAACIAACPHIADPANPCDPGAICDCHCQSVYGGSTARCPDMLGDCQGGKYVGPAYTAPNPNPTGTFQISGERGG